jgi:ABC-type nitrate/sulfonate/bicarbonate transport system substrate-binding protein
VNRRRFLAAAAAGAAALGTPGLRRAAAQPALVTFASTAGAAGLITQVARRLKLERQHDVRLDITYLDHAAAEKAVLLKQVDAGVFPVVSAADVNLRGQPVVIFAPMLYMHAFVVVGRESPYQRLGDLRGRRIGLLDKVSSVHRGMQILAARVGLDFERDFQPITSPPAEIVAMLQRGQVDALVIHEPAVSRLLAEEKFRVIMGLNQEWRKARNQSWLVLGAAAHRDWLVQNRAIARRVADVLLDAARAVNRDPDLVEAEAEILRLRTPAEIDLAKQRLPQFLATEWNDTVVAEAMQAVSEAARLGQLAEVPEQQFMTLLR